MTHPATTPDLTVGQLFATFSSYPYAYGTVADIAESKERTTTGAHSKRLFFGLLNGGRLASLFGAPGSLLSGMSALFVRHHYLTLMVPDLNSREITTMAKSAKKSNDKTTRGWRCLPRVHCHSNFVRGAVKTQQYMRNVSSASCRESPTVPFEAREALNQALRNITCLNALVVTSENLWTAEDVCSLLILVEDNIRDAATKLEGTS